MSCNSLLAADNPNLAVHLSLNEVSGTVVADNSDNNNDGVSSVDMSAITDTGKFGAGVIMGGSESISSAISGGVPDYPFSIGCWFLHEGDAAVRSIVALGAAGQFGTYWQVKLTNINALYAARRNTTAYEVSVATGVTQAWHHVLAVFPDDDTMAVYYDGSEVYNETGLDAVDATAAADTFYVGDFRDTDAIGHFIGSLDEPALWTAELSATDAAQLAAGPEPIWLGTGTHHFNVARDIAYWNCPSSAWGLPSYLNAASTDNGALTAEVRIVRDRGKATEEVIATSTGFSGSVAYSGTETNLTLELRVSNDGGYDDSLGDDADGWVSVAWYGLEAKLVGQWNLDEQSGTVARNQVRTTLIDDDFTSGSTTGNWSGNSGDLPTGWSEYASSLEGDETVAITLTNGVLKFALETGATSNDFIGIGTAVTLGVTYVARVRYRLTINANRGGFRIYEGPAANWITVDATDSGGVWKTVDTIITPGVSTMYFTLWGQDANSNVELEIDSIELYEENAGTYDRDASNTYLSIADLGTIDGGQDFNGSSDRATTPASVTLGESLTAATWARLDAVGAPGFSSCFFGSGTPEFRPLMLDTNQDTLGFAGGGFTNNVNAARLTAPADDILDNDWHHIASTWNTPGDGTGTVSFYVDGLLVGQHSLTSAVSTPFTIWLGDNSALGQELNGALSNARIYSRALASYEIAQLYAEGPLSQLDVARVGHFKLEEAAGLVCRNEVRTTIYDDDFTGGSTTTADGDVPTGWTAYKSAVLPTFSLSDSGSTTTITADGEGSATAFVGLQKTTGLTSGVAYVVAVRYRVRSRSGAPSLSVFGGAWQSKLLDSVALNEWQTAEFTFTATSAVLAVAAGIFPSSEAIVMEIDSIEVYAENAATPSEDMSGLTAPGVSGRGANLSGTSYISAPWDGGFTYPTSVGCAFKLDTLTDSVARTLLSLTDASAADVYWQVLIPTNGLSITVNRRNTTNYTAGNAGVGDTDWHTVVIVFHDETTVSFYQDGVLLDIETGLDSVSASANVDTLLIGLLRLTSPTQYADGITFDEVSAWNRELSAYDVMNWTRGVLSQKPSVFNTGLAIGL